MSRLLTLQNHLKIRATAELLTDHQRRAYDDVLARWRYPETVNLCGPAGSGKTFTCWALARERDVPFFATPERFEAATLAPGVTVLVDNVNVDAYPLRRLLAALQLRGIRTALLISRHANPGLLPVVALPPPTTADVTVVLHNLSQLDYYALNPPESSNLWQIIRATLVDRSSPHEP